MTKSETFTDSASPEFAGFSAADERSPADRMREYKTLAMAFSYPNAEFLSFFADLGDRETALKSDYDRLFRAGAVWLETLEYLAENEFQRAALLSDVMAFYRAFGMEPDRQRPDTLPCELEFMHVLIAKEARSASRFAAEIAREKEMLCRAAQKKFFSGFIEPTAPQIAGKIIASAREPFYLDAATTLLSLVEKEKNWFAAHDIQLSVADVCP